ncbi:MAG TPA: aminotransferase class I/II-fold pyridoxal phosphate-dependent enzyme [Mycobacteriales bacterium]|nr:aminotransferase class I/II-fold pyridoxal phosphate-dependent enzyme [Mycobacteriales bacterium]
MTWEDPLGWLGPAAAARAAAGVHRELRPRQVRGGLLDVAGNDYLGLSTHPAVVAAGHAALDTWGAGATGSRLVTGTTAVHAELEQQLALFTGAPAALVFSSGYLANLAAVAAVVGAGGLLVSDERAHASLIDAARLCRADVVVAPHADLAAVDRILAAHHGRSLAVVTESVSSADGDLVELAPLHGVVRRHGGVLLVDDAHGIGVVGAGGVGAVAAAGLAGEPDVVVTITLSKALGAQGGAVLCRKDLVEHLINTGRSFIFDTGLAPVSAASALAALDQLVAEPGLAARVRERAKDIDALARERGLASRRPDAAVVPVMVGDAGLASAAARTAAQVGVHVGCFRPPSVPAGTSRLRLTARADLSPDDLELVASALDAVAQLCLGARS